LTGNREKTDPAFIKQCLKDGFGIDLDDMTKTSRPKLQSASEDSEDNWDSEESDSFDSDSDD